MKLLHSVCGRKSRWTLTDDPDTADSNKIVRAGQIFVKNWRFFINILAPIILSLIPIYWKGNTGKEPLAAYVIVLMATYWVTESIPLAVTSFFPVILFPLFGIVDTDTVTSAYLQDSILFLFGGCVIALSFEYCNFHTRIALKIIMVVGTRISQLMFGIMFTTMFLSMWMNNTSTTAMIVPVISAIHEELRKKMINPGKDSDAQEPYDPEVSTTHQSEPSELKHNRSSSTTSAVLRTELENKDKNIKADEKEKRIHKRVRDLKTMFLLATAYSSNIGGTGVITGSATNVIVLDLVRKDADEDLASSECRQYLSITFLDWMMFNAPPMILNTIVCWGYLQIHFLGFPDFLKFWKKKSEEEEETERVNKSVEASVKRAIKEKYDQLGGIRFNEVGTVTLFIIMVILWIFKDPQFIPGWDSLPIFGRTASGKSFIKECTPTLLICTLLCVIPGKSEYYKNFRTGGLAEGIKDPLLSFDFILQKFPWGIFILLGGGSAMALGAKESGLNKWMKEFLENNETLQSLPGPAILLVVLFLVAVLTSLASNTACAAIITPVLLGLSYVKNMHPLYMVYAASTACSYAFVLPVSTPPNAIVYSSSDLKLTEMMKPGFLINVICILMLFLTTHTTGNWIFNFDGYNDQCKSMTNVGIQ